MIKPTAKNYFTPDNYRDMNFELFKQKKCFINHKTLINFDNNLKMRKMTKWIKITALTILIFAVLKTKSQETFTYMQYNLLYYGSYNSFCTSSNNNINEKADNLATVIAYVQPDIFCVNEMDDSQYAVNHLLGNSLNVNGVNHYRSASILNTNNSNIINMLYYNRDKFNLLEQESVTTNLRDINIYKLSYKNSDPLVTFRVVVAHLKAGYSTENQNKRALMTEKLMDYLMNLSQTDKQNIILSGDFNTGSSSETAFQNLINPTQGNVIFLDPIDQLGDWYNNYSMRYYHTQSTHTSSDNECFSYGGIDDRFDFILTSDDIMQGDNGLTYVSGSYKTLGQDGKRFNNSLISPNNNSAPSDVIYAMYNFSDHLPVISTFEVSNTNAIATFNAQKSFEIKSLTTDEASINFDLISSNNQTFNIRIYDVLGHELLSTQIKVAGNEHINLPCTKSGVLIIHIQSSKGEVEVIKCVK